jgi:hypothetical protein
MVTMGNGQIGGWSSPSTSTTHMRQAPKPGSLGS